MNLVLPRDPKYGWIPDLPDQRDFSYVRLAVALPPLPKAVDLRARCSPVEDQGKIGSCTACALVGNLEFLKVRTLKKVINFSKLFLYYNERAIRHTQRLDSGASLRDGIKTLVKIGDCQESFWPYSVSKLAVKPPSNAYTDALHYQITSYYRLHTLDEMKHAIGSGYPFVFGFVVYESFESKKVRQTGIVPMPESDERVVGGHAVCAVGYDDIMKWFIVRNSWGSGWGDHGYCYMPYSYVTTSSLAADYWTIRDME